VTDPGNLRPRSVCDKDVAAHHPRRLF
jgi:hypothetical protein